MNPKNFLRLIAGIAIMAVCICIPMETESAITVLLAFPFIFGCHLVNRGARINDYGKRRQGIVEGD